jgi:uncharacterized protein YsxB (DUF464 family)
MNALWLGLEGILELDNVKKIIDRNKPEMCFEWDPGIPEVRVLGQTIAASLKALADSYSDRVKYREINQEDRPA